MYTSLLSLFLLGCSTPTGIVSISLEQDPVTIATAHVSPAMPANVWVEYGLTEDYDQITPVSELSIHHDISLLGLRGDTTYHYRVMGDVGGVTSELDVGTFHTNPLPDSLPQFDVEGGADGSPDYTLFTMQWNDQEDHLDSAVYVIDAAGEIVWYEETTGMVLAAHLTRDGRGIAYQTTRVGTLDSPDASTIERVTFDGSRRTTLANPLGHHDFVELPDGCFASLTTQVLNIDGTSIAGDTVVGLYPDGSKIELWNAFDELPITWNESWTGQPYDWTHANGISYDEDRDLFAVSLFQQHQVRLFTGDGSWSDAVGGEDGYSFVGDPGFGPQHGPRLTDRGLQVFDNAGGGVSRLVEYALDDQARTATELWSQANPWGEQVVVMGDGILLPDGGTISTWGDRGEILTLSPEGQMSRLLQARDAGVIGRVSVFDSFYPDL